MMPPTLRCSRPLQGQHIDSFPFLFILIYFSLSNPPLLPPFLFFLCDLHAIFTPLQNAVYFQTTEFISCSQYVCGYRAVHFSTGNLSKSTLLKKVDLPYPSGHHGPIAPSWGGGVGGGGGLHRPFPICARIFSAPILFGSYPMSCQTHSHFVPPLAFSMFLPPLPQ